MDNRNWTIKFYFIIIEINKIFMNFKVLIYFDIYIIITGKTLFLITLKFFHTLQQGYPNDFWSGPVCDDIIVGGPGASPPPGNFWIWVSELAFPYFEENIKIFLRSTLLFPVLRGEQELLGDPECISAGKNIKTKWV